MGPLPPGSTIHPSTPPTPPDHPSSPPLRDRTKAPRRAASPTFPHVPQSQRSSSTALPIPPQEQKRRLTLLLKRPRIPRLEQGPAPREENPGEEVGVNLRNRGARAFVQRGRFDPQGHLEEGEPGGEGESGGAATGTPGLVAESKSSGAKHALPSRKRVVPRMSTEIGFHTPRCHNERRPLTRLPKSSHGLSSPGQVISRSLSDSNDGHSAP